jgi:hypothetical protein
MPDALAAVDHRLFPPRRNDLFLSIKRRRNMFFQCNDFHRFSFFRFLVVADAGVLGRLADGEAPGILGRDFKTRAPVVIFLFRQFFYPARNIEAQINIVDGPVAARRALPLV